MKSTLKYLFFYWGLTLLTSVAGLSQTYTAKQLYDEHRKNSALFESKYRNQKITVSGKIRSIAPVSYYWQGDENYHKVHLTATGYENYVTCQIPYKDSVLLKTLKVGETVTVTGVVAPTIVDALWLTDCSFGSAKPVVTKKTAPENPPLGKYNVYQNDAAGFSYQYTFNLTTNSYFLNGKTGTYRYDKSGKVIQFISGPLKGFAGVYRPFSENEQDPPTIIINPGSDVPDLKAVNKGYQYGYFKGR